MPNELIISENEFNALIKSQPYVRYQYALKRIVDTETMWSFVDNNGAFLFSFMVTSGCFRYGLPRNMPMRFV